VYRLDGGFFKERDTVRRRRGSTKRSRVSGGWRCPGRRVDDWSGAERHFGWADLAVQLSQSEIRFADGGVLRNEAGSAAVGVVRAAEWTIGPMQRDTSGKPIWRFSCQRTKYGSQAAGYYETKPGQQRLALPGPQSGRLVRCRETLRVSRFGGSVVKERNTVRRRRGSTKRSRVSSGRCKPGC